MRSTAFENVNQLTLGELIDLIEKAGTKHKLEVDGVETDKTIDFDFGSAHPDGLTSWRGAYEELALCYALGETAKVKPPTAQSFLDELKEANGKVFEGWKGGDFKMDLDTPLWVANSGNTSNTAVVGIHNDSYCITILTAYCEY